MIVFGLLACSQLLRPKSQVLMNRHSTRKEDVIYGRKYRHGTDDGCLHAQDRTPTARALFLW